MSTSTIRKMRLAVVFVMGIVLFLSSLAIPAHAADMSTTKLIDKIVRENPGSTKEMVLHSAEEIARKTGKSQKEVLEQFVDEIHQNDLSRKKTLAEVGVTETDCENRKSYQLCRSYYKGDMFLTPAYTAFVNHGHIGIYGDKDWIVEAPGFFAKSRWAWHYNTFVGKGTVLMETTLTQAQQNAAADYAYNHLLGYPYNPIFWNNKELNPERLNCSQLVWLAYKKGAGVDLDGNGGAGVYPYDIKDSKYTKVNWVIE